MGILHIILYPQQAAGKKVTDKSSPRYASSDNGTAEKDSFI